MKTELLISDDIISSKIYLIRNQKVMLDRDLASLYGVKTKVLNQAVKRNLDRFPEDFMFELTKTESDAIRSQIVTLKRGQNTKYLPFAFTEQGVAMLSSVLNSQQAILVNIQIIRLFTKLRKLLLDTTDLRVEIEFIKKKLRDHKQNIELVFKYLDELIAKQTKEKPRKKIGYKMSGD
ncbi:MAG: ORF6N domain-containing protein [Bacteroidia bacterium]|nr:ORF6N domain-containing protein [Bacteroidia bacterium]